MVEPNKKILDTSSIIKEGYLHKQSKYMKEWRK